MEHIEEFVRQAAMNQAAELEIIGALPTAPNTLNPIVDRQLRHGDELFTPEALLDGQTHVAVVGDAGIGKTTLFRALAFHLAANYSANGIIPIFIQARDISSESLDSVEQLISSCFDQSVSAMASHVLQSQNAAILVDGIDELEAEKCVRLLQMIEELAQRAPRVSASISTRPYRRDFLPKGFSVFELMPLSDLEVRKYLSSQFQAEQSARLSATIDHGNNLRDLVHNPLLLTMVASVYRETGALPSTREEMNAASIDTMLRKWDKHKGVDVSANQREVRAFLSDLALWMLRNQRVRCSHEELTTLWERFSSRLRKPLGPMEGFLGQIFRSGVLLEAGPQQFQFAHRTFQEYLAALSLSKEPPAIAASESITLGIADSVAEASLNSEELLAEHVAAGHYAEAISIAKQNRGIGKAAKRSLIQTIVVEIGFDDEPPTEEDGPSGDGIPWNQLIQEWEQCDNATTSHERGLALENFSETFFGLVFNVVDTRRLTDAGEVDLVCEIRQADTFWGRWNSDFFIECKNHADRSPVSDVNAFIGKSGVCRAELAFLLSANGFTSFASKTLLRSWGNNRLPDIVWINRPDVEQLFEQRVHPNEFLKRMCRRANDGRG